MHRLAPVADSVVSNRALHDCQTLADAQADLPQQLSVDPLFVLSPPAPVPDLADSELTLQRCVKVRDTVCFSGGRENSSVLECHVHVVFLVEVEGSLEVVGTCSELVSSAGSVFAVFVPPEAVVTVRVGRGPFLFEGCSEVGDVRGSEPVGGKSKSLEKRIRKEFKRDGKDLVMF